jgi:hypothetical protein
MSVPWTRRTALTAAFVVAFVVIQLVVPAVALFGSRPAPFGWQMYAAMPQLPRAWVVDTQGTETPVDLFTLFATQRAEVDYASALERHLCDRTDAAAVRVQRPGDDESKTVICQ